MATIPLITKIQQSSQPTRKQNVIETVYGDGYKQIAGWGINNKVDEWRLQWVGLTQADRNTLYSSWDLTTVWQWQPPNAAGVYNWRFVGSYQETNVSGDKYDVTLQIEQVFIA